MGMFDNANEKSDTCGVCPTRKGVASPAKVLCPACPKRSQGGVKDYLGTMTFNQMKAARAARRLSVMNYDEYKDTERFYEYEEAVAEYDKYATAALEESQAKRERT